MNAFPFNHIADEMNLLEVTADCIDSVNNVTNDIQLNLFPDKTIGRSLPIMMILTPSKLFN